MFETNFKKMKAEKRAIKRKAMVEKISFGVVCLITLSILVYVEYLWIMKI